MSQEAGSCHAGPGARTRKPKKPHYIPRPWGKPYNYKCFQCPFTCLEKSHLYNHMKYSLCKDSLSLLLHAPRPRAPALARPLAAPTASLNAAPSTPDLDPAGDPEGPPKTLTSSPREAKTGPGLSGLHTEAWKRGLGTGPRRVAPANVATVGPEGGVPCYPPPLPGGPPETQSFHLPLLGLSYPLGPTLFSCLGPSLAAAHVPFLASAGPLLPVACPAPQGPGREPPVPRLYCPLLLGLPAGGAAPTQPPTLPKGPPATLTPGLGGSWPWGIPSDSGQLEQVTLRVAKRTLPPGSRSEPLGPLPNTAKPRSWSSLRSSPTQRRWPEEQELGAPRMSLSQQSTRRPECPLGETLGRALGDITRVELPLGGPAPRSAQEQPGRTHTELLDIHQTPDLPLDLSVRSGSAQAHDDPPRPWRRPPLDTMLTQGSLGGPSLVGPAGPLCGGRTTKCEADSSIPPPGTPPALEDLTLPHSGWAPHIGTGGPWTPGAAPGLHSPRGSEL